MIKFNENNDEEYFNKSKDLDDMVEDNNFNVSLESHIIRNFIKN